MLASLKARQRHQKLMRAAHHLLRDAWLSLDRQQADITAADLAAYAFGRHRIDLDPDEAQRFLEAARVARGEPTIPSA
ncbi:hypothetical protein ACFWR9_42240 [Streptomyces sp. NPDC058534]|uniref:hypothetical protein n=1 Tax=Streptomyces sp. NPDC058534 TaxID=3346541 RepID=UPI0036626818